MVVMCDSVACTTGNGWWHCRDGVGECYLSTLNWRIHAPEHDIPPLSRAAGHLRAGIRRLRQRNLCRQRYGELSPDGYSLVAVLLAETILTAIFLYVILGATDDRAPQGFAPVAIGLALTLIHLVSIPISNTSVNPARSLGVAWFAGSEPLMQVWAFIVAPLVGAAIAGLTYKSLFPNTSEVVLER